MIRAQLLLTLLLTAFCYYCIEIKGSFDIDSLKKYPHELSGEFLLIRGLDKNVIMAFSENRAYFVYLSEIYKRVCDYTFETFNETCLSKYTEISGYPLQGEEFIVDPEAKLLHVEGREDILECFENLTELHCEEVKILDPKEILKSEFKALGIKDYKMVKETNETCIKIEKLPPGRRSSLVKSMPTITVVEKEVKEVKESQYISERKKRVLLRKIKTILLYAAPVIVVSLFLARRYLKFKKSH